MALIIYRQKRMCSFFSLPLQYVPCNSNASGKSSQLEDLLVQRYNGGRGALTAVTASDQLCLYKGDTAQGDTTMTRQWHFLEFDPCQGRV